MLSASNCYTQPEYMMELTLTKVMYELCYDNYQQYFRSSIDELINRLVSASLQDDGENDEMKLGNQGEEFFNCQSDEEVFAYNRNSFRDLQQLIVLLARIAKTINPIAELSLCYRAQDLLRYIFRDEVWTRLSDNDRYDIRNIINKYIDIDTYLYEKSQADSSNNFTEPKFIFLMEFEEEAEPSMPIASNYKHIIANLSSQQPNTSTNWHSSLDSNHNYICNDMIQHQLNLETIESTIKELKKLKNIVSDKNRCNDLYQCFAERKKMDNIKGDYFAYSQISNQKSLDENKFYCQQSTERNDNGTGKLLPLNLFSSIKKTLYRLWSLKEEKQAPSSEFMSNAIIKDDQRYDFYIKEFAESLETQLQIFEVMKGQLKLEHIQCQDDRHYCNLDSQPTTKREKYIDFDSYIDSDDNDSVKDNIEDCDEQQNIKSINRNGYKLLKHNELPFDPYLDRKCDTKKNASQTRNKRVQIYPFAKMYRTYGKNEYDRKGQLGPDFDNYQQWIDILSWINEYKNQEMIVHPHSAQYVHYYDLKKLIREESDATCVTEQNLINDTVNNNQAAQLSQCIKDNVDKNDNISLTTTNDDSICNTTKLSPGDEKYQGKKHNLPSVA